MQQTPFNLHQQGKPVRQRLSSTGSSNHSDNVGAVPSMRAARRGALALAILCSPALVYAQAQGAPAPQVPDAGRLLETNRAPALIVPPKAGGTVLPDSRPNQGVQLAGAQRVMVRRFTLQGVSALPEAALQQLLQPYTGRELSFDELSQAANAVSTYYRKQGYFLATAVLPAQELGQGEVRIMVLEGRVSEIRLVPDATVRLQPAQARRYLDALTPLGQALRDAPLERALLLTDDFPGVSARTELSPGAQRGETALDVALTEGPLLNGSLGLDNSSNRYTGRVRLQGGLNFNDIGGLGGQASLLASTTGADFNYARLGYVMPVGDHGTRVGGAYSHLRYHLGAEFASLNGFGGAAVVQVLLTHPLLRSGDSNIQLRLGYDDKRYTNDANGARTSDKQVQALPLGVSYTSQDTLFGGGYSIASVDLTAGRVDLSGNAAALAADAASAATQGRFTHTNYQFGRYQRVGAGATAIVSLNGQLASHNLESGEKISLGGPGRVRAYPAGEASGDAGYVATLEGRYELPALKSELAAFFDYGHVTLNHSVYAGALAPDGPGNSYSLKGVGLGWTWRPLARTSVQLQVAAKVGSNPARNAKGNDADGSAARSRAWFQISTYF
ncbi:ShlB/FhaC/HecB family hemolysin secretion/activation protein [Rugamonas sp. CCM 8940]|uniref:ShlB/FhaC/HecB family hemolysin secretion/activation protein n=1 Tax=Rugamonas sp. CCM 8940 TaxID=2765359 RepID=UPI0018F5B7AE|nr:ShlB/FhaC/HecB family hemolysin secretion/activation protein [Rugamonas sp. CCM 8940]MBJ7309371.1 ShlB/FhaC/HecB family hemolysin secretion/activation protein [Rugamonas sp. CCM 8940]